MKDSEDEVYETLQSRLLALEEVARRESQHKKEVFERVKRTEMAFREVQNLIKTIERGEDVIQLKSIIQENIT